ncbi:orotidine-5'-phosphate decarboxylase [bacterium]|nr:MAG: orotidine-5'-phosphate decarboxylase [bacterium]
MTFHQRTEKALAHSSVCVGLDPDLNLIPAILKSESNPVLAFNRALIDATVDVVGAYKPNFAFYEVMGIEGWLTLTDTVKHIRSRSDKVIIIADAKRGDIGNTSSKYAQAILQEMDFDCITINPYMGRDSVEPFIQDENKGAFVLCLTSNKGSEDFQRLDVNGRKNYVSVAQNVLSWNTLNNCGLVVGATHPEEMQNIRSISGKMPFLVPGIGVQGGDLEAVVKSNWDGRKVNAFINSSRAVIYASKEKDFAERARAEVLKLKKSIERIVPDIKK